MRARNTIAAILFGCSGLLLSAQQAGQNPLPSFRSGTELVTVDVGVVDKQGQPLRDLKPSDFTVTVGGQPRRVITAEFIDVAALQPGAPGRDQIVPLSTNEGGGVGRLFVFIVDQSTLDPGGLRDVARAASGFLDRLTFADRSAMMVLPVGPTIEFTWSHDRVREALQRVPGTPRTLSTWDSGSLSEARDIANRGTFALRAVAERECGLSGGSISASSAGAAAGPVGAPTGGATGPGPAGGGGGTGAPAGGAGGAGGAPTGGGTATGAGGSGGGGATGGAGVGSIFGRDSCSRDLQMQAESTWRVAQMTSQASLMSLRQVLSKLARVRGDKTVILISGGWPLDEREENSILSSVATEAAAARATLYTLFVPTSSFSADRRMMSTSPARDQYLHSGPLDTLAQMTGGAYFRAEVNADAAFSRLGRELTGYYRVGVEKDPTDLDGKARHLKVRVARSGATARARELFDLRAYEDRDWAARLGSALDAPIPATGLGLRVTSYLAADPDDRSRVKLVIAGEASRMQPGEATVQVVLRDLDGKKVLSAEPPVPETHGDGMSFSTNFPVMPGSYIVRIAIMDSAGRVGSVEHRVEARAVPLGAFSATGPLLIGVPDAPETAPRVLLDSVQQGERLALEVDLQGETAKLAGAAVVFDIAASADGPALIQANASLTPDLKGGSMLAQAVTDVRVLPPGTYVVRATVKSGGDPVGDLRRTLAVTSAVPIARADGSAAETVVGRTAPAAASIRTVGAVRPFRFDQVLAPKILNAFLDRVAARPDSAAPGIHDLLERARAGSLGDLIVPQSVAADAPVAAFVRGLSLLSQKQLDPAAEAFRSAIRVSADFYPAMVYLGACYAAGGHDKEAAAAWRTALIKEGETVAVHQLLADALLRQGQRDLAFEAVSGALARWPQDEDLKRQFAVAALVAGKYAEGLQAVDELIAAHADDEPSLSLALLTLYEAFESDRPVGSIEQDRARMVRLADAYRARGGPSLALVDAWVAAAAPK
ncbi:MAG: VWA domain-containing protein [Acidobacteriota bacterium]